MAIPTPSVKPLQVPGGTHTYVYNDIIGTVGPILYIDLTDIPGRLREDPNFQEMLYVIFKGLDDDITAVSPAVLAALNFGDDGAEINAWVQLNVTSAVGTALCMIIVEPRHTIGR